MAAKRKDVDLSVLDTDPAAYPASVDAKEQSDSKKEKEKYSRVNIFIPEASVQTYKDFQLFAKDCGVSTSALLVSFMEKTVEANREAIEEARQRFEIRAKSKPF